MVRCDGDAAGPPEETPRGHPADPAGAEPCAAPCVLAEGQLTVDGVELGALVAGLEGHAVWLLSHGALSRCLASCDGPRSFSVGRVGPPVVLGLLAGASWWARCQTPRELQVARAAGFPADRLVASGRVKDDGFLKDALTLGVGVLETVDDADAANVARLAAYLECKTPPGAGQPADVALCALQGCGGLLTPVLHSSPQLTVDAPWSAWSTADSETSEPLHVWPVRAGASSGELTDGTLEGLSSAAAAPARAVRIHGGLERGDWALVLSDRAFGRPFEDPALPTPETVMTRDGIWRFVEERSATD